MRWGKYEKEAETRKLRRCESEAWPKATAFVGFTKQAPAEHGQSKQEMRTLRTLRMPRTMVEGG